MGYGVIDMARSAVGKLLGSPGAVKDSALDAAGPTWTPLGWRVATFAAETFVPEDRAKTTITAVWHRYRQWCHETSCEPLFYPLFVLEFDKVMAEAGVPRVQQGANLYYRTLGVRPA